MNSERLQQRINNAEQLHTTGGFHEMEEINTGCLDETYGEATLGDPHTIGGEEQKVLRLRWRLSDDCLMFDFSTITQLASSLEPMKRNVISIVGRFYDPLGFLAAATIRFKIFFQKLRLLGINLYRMSWHSSGRLWWMAFVGLLLLSSREDTS